MIKKDLLAKALRVTEAIQKNEVVKKSKAVAFKTPDGISYMVRDKVPGSTLVNRVNKNKEALKDFKNGSSQTLRI